MSVKKFKFVSPGVFLNEIDNSQIPKISDAVGPVLIGRSERGPALKPVRVESFSDFVEVFGAPIAGGQGNDVWRQGNGYLAPTYAAYAAQAYLRNSAPVTFIRLAGIEESGAVAGSNSTGNMGNAGWQGRNGHGSGTTPQAWGIFVGVQKAEPTATQVLKTTSGAAIAANATITIQKDSATPEAADPAVFKVVDRVSASADQVVSVQPEEANRIGKSFIVNVPSSTADALAEAAGEFTAGQGADITIKVVNNLTDPEPGNGEVHVLNAGGNNATGATNVRNRIRAAINGTDDLAFNVLHIKYGANTGPVAAGDATGIRGITAVDSADAADEKTLKIVAVSGGLPGNSIAVKRGAANNTDLVDADVTLSGAVGTDMTKAGTEADPFLIGMGGTTATQKNNSVFTALAHASSIEAKIPTIAATQSSNGGAQRLTMVRTYTTAVPKGTHNKTVALSANSNITQEDAGGAADTTFASQVDSAKSALAAVIYPNSTSKEVEVCLSGIKAFGDDNDAVDGAALVASSAPKSHVAVLQSNDQLSTAQFTLHIRDDKSGATSPEIKTAVVDFSPSSPNFIRKVLNTNPVKTNADIIDPDGLERYWLGESYEHYLANEILQLANGEKAFAWTAPLQEGTMEHGNNLRQLSPAQTGWFISQNTAAYDSSWTPNSQQKLFKFVALNDGESQSRDFKISISNIKPAPKGSVNSYGTFTVLIRKADDSDNAPQIVERFSNCDLNPYSSDYIARKIGDMYHEWHSGEKLYKHYGNYENMSRFIRVEVNSDVDQGVVSQELLPVGVFGPPVYKSMPLTLDADGQEAAADIAALKTAGGGTNWWTGAMAKTAAENNKWITGHPNAPAGITLSVDFPTLRLRELASDGGVVDPSRAFFGLQTTRSKDSTRMDPGYIDYVRPMGNVTPYSGDTTIAQPGNQQYSWVFTLDDMVVEAADGAVVKAKYVKGSHAGDTKDTNATNVTNGQNATQASGSPLSAHGTDGLRKLLTDYEINSFTSPMFGGFDGVDVTEAEAFSNRKLSGISRPYETNSYVYASIKRALDACSDPEAVESNIMSMPGITDETLTTLLVRQCESRADSLAVIDLPDVYKPAHEKQCDYFKDRIGDGVQSVVDVFSNRGINSSYGCTYYPWVKIYDEITDSQVWVPPSVIALGTFANTEKKAALWFAPAGFNRGGLTAGSAGLPVIGVTERLTSKDRDKLYDVNINPIATFPAEGIVVFGQKTLQTSQSALDRINVRRLLIFVKKQVSRISNKILFDQNVQATWDRFTSQVEPFLDRIKLGFGLTDFKVVLDRTTTTPDLIDRNILYAKIFLKPARSIEFIAIDFIITNTGAAFED